MIDFPFSMTIDKARDFYLNGCEVLQALAPEAADIWPRQQNSETLIHDVDGRILYSATVGEVFTGPRCEDFKQVVLKVYDRQGQLVYTTDMQPYLDAGAAAYEAYKRRGRHR